MAGISFWAELSTFKHQMLFCAFASLGWQHEIQNVLCSLLPLKWYYIWERKLELVLLLEKKSFRGYFVLLIFFLPLLLPTNDTERSAECEIILVEFFFFFFFPAIREWHSANFNQILPSAKKHLYYCNPNAYI